MTERESAQFCDSENAREAFTFWTTFVFSLKILRVVEMPGAGLSGMRHKIDAFWVEAILLGTIDNCVHNVELGGCLVLMYDRMMISIANNVGEEEQNTIFTLLESAE